MAEKIYPKGLRCFAPRQGAPDFVLGTLIVTPSELSAWVEANQQYMTEYKGTPQLRLDLLKGNDGPYVAVNTYKPGAVSGAVDAYSAKPNGTAATSSGTEPVEDLPF